MATKILARSNHPRTSGTYPRQDDVFGVRTAASTVWSGVLPIFQNLSYKLSYREDCLMSCPSTKSSKGRSKCFPSSRRVTRRRVMRHFTRNGTDQCQNGSSNLLTPCREQSRSARIVLAYPRPAFSATKRTNHARISFDNKPKFLTATRYTEIRKNLVPKFMAVEALSR